MKMTVLSELREIVEDVCVEHGDGCAKSRRGILLSGYLSTYSAAVTTGTFFTVLMLAMGATDVYFGYVSLIGTVCSFVQFFAPLFWERLKVRKALLMTLSAASSFLTYGVLTCVPFLPCSDKNKLWLYLLITFLAALLTNFSTPASSAWTMQIIPTDKRVNFTSISNLIGTVINVVCTFLAGVLLDKFEADAISVGGISPALTAIILIRITAFLMITLSTVIYASWVREFPYTVEKKTALKDNLMILLRPLKNKPFLLSILCQCIWSLTAAIIGNFFSLHLVENVKMSYTLISSASVIATPMILLFTPLWTIILRRQPWIRTLAIAFFGYSFGYLCNVFISAETQIFYFIAIVLGNIFAPCINMVSGNLMFRYIPEEDRTAYFSFYAFAVAVSTFFGQTIGTLFVQYTDDLSLRVFGVSVCNLQLTSAIAMVGVWGLAVYTLWYHQYTQKHEPTK